MSYKLQELAKELVSICEKHGLKYDPNVLPIKLTADCYIIYVTPITHECKSHGECKVEQYYALTGGDNIKLTTSKHET